MEPEEPDFFTDYLSHVLLSGHSDSFSKYDKKLFLYKLSTSALIVLTHMYYLRPCFNCV